jgi:hypothetical protein
MAEIQVIISDLVRIKSKKLKVKRKTMTNPSFTQLTFRLRNDDNDEVNATWKQTQGTDDTIDTGSNFRCRFRIDETASRLWTNKTWNLYYQLTGDANYYAVTGSTPVQFSLSNNFTDGADCTTQLTGGTGTFVTDNNGMKETTGGATNSGTAGQLFELEWCLKIDAAQVADGNAISLRVYDGTSAITAYTDTPVITVNDLGSALTALITDTVQVADTISNIRNISKLLTDTTQVGDVLSRAINKILALSDTTQISDTINRGIGKITVISDSIEISDTISKNIGFFRTLVDTINVSDILATARSITIVLSDLINPSDTLITLVTSGEGQVWQYSYPISDVTSGVWTNELDSYVNIYTSIDEETYNDSDYIQSPSAPSNDSYTTLMSGLLTPETKTNHTLFYRYSATISGISNLTVKLMQGVTEIAQWVHSGVGIDWVTAEQSLTQGQMDAITDYTDLRITFVADV